MAHLKNIIVLTSFYFKMLKPALCDFTSNIEYDGYATGVYCIAVFPRYVSYIWIKRWCTECLLKKNMTLKSSAFFRSN